MKIAWATGLAGGALSAIALAVFGKRASGSAVAPVNAVSHWAWGDEAFDDDRVTLRHTPLGLATHLGAAVFWGTLFERMIRRRPVAGPIAASATAFAVDYTITPGRLRPGYEHKLDNAGMLAVYAALAAGFAAAALARRA